MENNNFQITSDWLPCKSDEKKIFSFLTSIQHLESILPKDKVNSIEIIQDNKLKFQIESIITLTLFIKHSHLSENADKPSVIEYQSEPFGKYHLNLIVHLQNNQSQISLTGHLNPFVLSIAKNKLTHLVKRINQELAQLALS